VLRGNLGKKLGNEKNSRVRHTVNDQSQVEMLKIAGAFGVYTIFENDGPVRYDLPTQYRPTSCRDHMKNQISSSNPKCCPGIIVFCFGGYFFSGPSKISSCSPPIIGSTWDALSFFVKAARFFITFFGTAVVVLIFNRRWLIFIAMMIACSLCPLWLAGNIFTTNVLLLLPSGFRKG